MPPKTYTYRFKDPKKQAEKEKKDKERASAKKKAEPKKKAQPKKKAEPKVYIKGDFVVYKNNIYQIDEVIKTRALNEKRYGLHPITASPYYKSIKKDNDRGGKDIHYKFEGYNFLYDKNARADIRGGLVSARFLKKIKPLDLEKRVRGDRPGFLGIPSGKSSDQYTTTQDKLPPVIPKFIQYEK